MTVRPSVPFAVLFLALAAACADSPTSPADPVADLASLISVAQGAPGGGAPMLLDKLLHEALAKVMKEKGEDAVRALTAELRARFEAAHLARKAGDEKAFRERLDAALTEQARIIVTVLGPPVAKHALALVAEQMKRVGNLVAEAAKQGHDVTPLKQLLEEAARLNGEAEAALAAGNPVLALRIGAHAFDALGRAAPAGKPGQPAPALLDRLLHETLALVAKEKGEDAVKALTATLRALQQEAQDARKAGDKETFARKLDAAGMEAARIVVSVHGPRIAAHVIEQAGPRLERLRRLIEEAAKQGKDPAPLVKLAEQAGQLHREAAAALERGNPVLALRLGAKAIDLLAGF